MISQDRAKEILTEQLNKISLLRGKNQLDKDFQVWERDTRIRIERIFEKESSHVQDFANIRYCNKYIPSEDPIQNNECNKGLDRAESLLQSMINELDTWGVSDDSASTINPIIEIKRICDRFHKIARQMKIRHNGRPTLNVENEYDVQDLFHSLLHLYFDDIRREEFTPSHAGGSSRVDFLLKDINTVIEIKKTRPSLSEDKLRNELIVDSQCYKSHPDCKRLICFVYDPEERVSNPRGIENDLNDDRYGIPVTVFIRPQ